MKNARKIVMVLLALVFVVSLGMVVYRSMEYKKGEETYAEAESLAELPDFSQLPPPQPEEPPAQEEKPVYVDPYADALREMDFAALREVNSDVLGWILVPGTPISYPLVQGDDNQYYLNHTWKKWNSVVGSIFLECQNSPDLSDFHTIIYGHRMNNGSMFASLKHYKKQSYWKQHPCVYITDDNGTHKYDIFAAYEVSTQGTTYQIGFSGDQSRQDFLDYCVGQSVIETGITPHVYDQILTLSTCTGHGHATRWVVQAVKPGTPPAEPAPAPEPAPVPLPQEPAAPVEPLASPEEAAPSAEELQTDEAPENAGEEDAISEELPTEADSGEGESDQSASEELA